MSKRKSAMKVEPMMMRWRRAPSWARGIVVLTVFTGILVCLVLLVQWVLEGVLGVDLNSAAWTLIGGLIGIATIPALAWSLDL